MADAEVIILGGGPAGMMAGLLFARAGIKTLILEKHADFFRDFRGDTVHPSTMEILDQLGMLGRFLERPHNRVTGARLRIAGQYVTVGDLSHLNTPAPFIAMMPQWEFLDFLRDEAAHFPAFRLELNANVARLDEVAGRITGVTLADGRSFTAGKLVIAADGRSSIVRKDMHLRVTSLESPMDVFWFSVPKAIDSGERLLAIVEPGRMMVLINRGDYWQCAFIFPKGSAPALRAEGIAAMRTRISETAPELGPLESVLTNIDQLHLLTIELDRLDCWHRPGLLAIGDAAHAMSPMGGVGINLAIQDAVAAANLLAVPIMDGANIDAVLHRVKDRRRFPTRLVQAAQKAAQDRIIARLFRPGMNLKGPPWPIRMHNRFPLLRRIPGRMIGLGVRREHVQSPAA